MRRCAASILIVVATLVVTATTATAGAPAPPRVVVRHGLTEPVVVTIRNDAAGVVTTITPDVFYDLSTVGCSRFRVVGAWHELRPDGMTAPYLVATLAESRNGLGRLNWEDHGSGLGRHWAEVGADASHVRVRSPWVDRSALRRVSGMVKVMVAAGRVPVPGLLGRWSIDRIDLECRRAR